MILRLYERVLLGLLLVIAGGIVIHTPLTLWLGVQWPEAELIIKSWKEVLMGIGLVLLIVSAVQRGRASELLRDRLLQLALVFAGLHFIMAAFFQTGLDVIGAGLLIDLRFILYFVLVFGFLHLFPQYRRLFLYVLIGGAAVVIGFAVLQLVVLPKDILAGIGYSKATISPFLTVDENPAFIRINSTLRGPNPLGAYAVIMIGLLTAVSITWKLQKRSWWYAGAAAIALGLTLGASHSRSAIFAAIVTMIVITLIAVTAKFRKKLLLSFATVAVLGAGLLFLFRDSYLVANVVFHDNPATGAAVDSNADHASSLIYGLDRLIHQPFGAGIGSTGSPSLLSDNPLIIENYYLLVAHEVGWLGLIIFAWLFVEVLRRVWVQRQSALALGVFGSGIGLAIIGLLLPVWTDDTVGIVWWGLAAVAAAAPIASVKTTKKGKSHGTRKSN